MNLELTPKDFEPWNQETRVLLDMFLERGAVADCSKESPKTDAVSPFFLDRLGQVVPLDDEAAPAGPTLLTQMLSAFHLAREPMQALYVSRHLQTYLQAQAMAMSLNGALGFYGRSSVAFMGVPVRTERHPGWAHIGAYPDYQPHQQQAHHELHTKGSVTLQWNRREGKTFFCLRELFDGCLDNPGVYVYLGGSRAMVRNVVWPMLGEWMEREHHGGEGADRALISFANGSRLHLVHGDDTDRVRGLRPLGVAIDGSQSDQARFIATAMAAGNPAWFIESFDRESATLRNRLLDGRRR